MGRISHVGIRSLAVATALAITEAAYADPVKCERTIAEASAEFAQSKSKALQSCEDKKAGGKLVATTDCHTEAKTAASIEKAVDKLASTVAKDCGGKDKTCGTADDDALPTIGWGAVGACPNFEGGSCTGPITDCNGIADCIACVDEAAVDQAITLYYGDLADEQFATGSVVNKCQRAIGKETTKFLQAKSKALQKCWDERMKGKHENDCPDPGDGKAVDAIAKAEGKKVSAICKACGGPDKVCGGGDDLSPSDIGFPSDCPSVTIPDSASSCGGAILDLQDVVDCVDCVTEFKVDCMDRLAIPQFVPYPPECAGSTSTTTSTQAPTTTTPTTSTTSTTAPNLCGNGMVDPGEPCDPSSPGGAFLCAPGEVCTAACTCASTTTTSTEAPTTTLAPTTTSSSTTEAPTTSSTSSTETPTTSTTSTTQGYGSPSRAFLVEPGGILD